MMLVDYLVNRQQCASHPLSVGRLTDSGGSLVNVMTGPSIHCKYSMIRGLVLWGDLMVVLISGSNIMLSLLSLLYFSILTFNTNQISKKTKTKKNSG